MDYKVIQDIIRLVNKSDLEEVEIEEKGFKLRIKKRSSDSNVQYVTSREDEVNSVKLLPESQSHTEALAVEEPSADEKSNKNLFTITSPMIGTFYGAPSPDKPQYVKVGDTISKGQVICIIEAMKLFNEIESDIEGKVVKIVAENAQPVEYEQPLFIVELNN